LLGRELPAEAMFPNAVERWLTELDMTENVLAWVCPVVPSFPDVQARLGFSFVLSDVIDDQRQWPMSSLRRARIAKSYRDTFAVTNAAITNCETVERWLAEEGLRVRLVPNGMDIHGDIASWPPPAELARFARPIIGYSGSLTHRIDWSLIDALAKARPEWTVVLIGAAPDTAMAEAVLALPNVHALGVIPYDRAVRYIAAFDVAIVPHLRTSLSERMNPLKVYVYRSLGVPVVSTPVPNIEDFVDDIRIAMPEDFVPAIESALADGAARGRAFPSRELMQRCAWTTRVQDILRHIQEALDAQGGAA
jgi:glycosyltransferase involved in cell wall biosynthesis